MRQETALPRLLLAAAFAMPAALPAASMREALSPGTRPARVTIRGTGNAISIDRSAPPEPPAEEETAPSVLDEAIRMKASGTSDDALVWYLRGHREELPPVVDLDTVSALRDAGAGRSVVAFLSSVAAVEIGPTGAEGRSEGPEDYAGPAPEPYMTNELSSDLAWGGWGWGVVGNGDFGNGRGHRHGRVSDRGFGMRGRHTPVASPMPRPAPQRQGPPSQQSVRTPFSRR